MTKNNDEVGHMDEHSKRAWHEQSDAFRLHLDELEREGRTLSAGMRNLAERTDAWMVKVSRFGEVLLSAQSKTSPPMPLEAEQPSIPQDAAPHTPNMLQEQEASEPEMAFAQRSNSWLNRELQRQGEPVTEPEEFLPSEPATEVGYESFELNLGIKWLSRLGIVALLIGLAMALSYSFPHFPKELKIITGFVLALLLWFGGGKLYGHAPILSRVLQGGGLAIGYLSVFAIFFIRAVQLVDLPIVGFTLLLSYVAGILVLSHRVNSQSMSLLSLAFGYYTAGYAENSTVAYISTMMLILGTAGLAKMHPSWSVLPKANLLGAFWTYLFWEGRSIFWGGRHFGATLHDTASRLYLIGVFLVFHVISVLRAGRGDAVLNAINVFGCYLLYLTTQALPEWKGILEFWIATLQLGTLSLLYTLREEQRENALSLSLLVIGLIFGLFGVSRFFAVQQHSMILSAFALCFAVLAYKGVYRSVLSVAAYLALLWSSLSLMNAWRSFSDTSLMWNAVWFTASAFMLEGVFFKAHSAILRGVVLTMALLLYFAALWTVLPSEWRTIGTMASGFALLTAGFIAHRKIYRWTGLGWVFVLGGASLTVDLWMLGTQYKILLFVLLGIGLLSGSYGYVWLEKKLRKNPVE